MVIRNLIRQEILILFSHFEENLFHRLFYSNRKNYEIRDLLIEEMDAVLFFSIYRMIVENE